MYLKVCLAVPPRRHILGHCHELKSQSTDTADDRYRAEIRSGERNDLSCFNLVSEDFLVARDLSPVLDRIEDHDIVSYTTTGQACHRGTFSCSAHLVGKLLFREHGAERIHQLYVNHRTPDVPWHSKVPTSWQDVRAAAFLRQFGMRRRRQRGINISVEFPSPFSTLQSSARHCPTIVMTSCLQMTGKCLVSKVMALIICIRHCPPCLNKHILQSGRYPDILQKNMNHAPVQSSDTRR